MADTKVEVTYKPTSKTTLVEFKDHIELVESLLDATISAPHDVVVTIDKDYNDDRDIVVATWSV
jgi:hypothetical protein